MTRHALATALAVALAACNATTPPVGPENTCAVSCRANASVCTVNECQRGCNLIVDRLVEGEGDRIIGCIAKHGGAPPQRGAPKVKACSDRAFARCAAQIGIHADGGPPPPPPPVDFEDEE